MAHITTSDACSHSSWLCWCWWHSTICFTFSVQLGVRSHVAFGLGAFSTLLVYDGTSGFVPVCLNNASSHSPPLPSPPLPPSSHPSPPLPSPPLPPRSGDLALLSMAAVVNPSSESFSDRNPVSDAIYTAAGPELKHHLKTVVKSERCLPNTAFGCLCVMCVGVGVRGLRVGVDVLCVGVGCGCVGVLRVWGLCLWVCCVWV